MEGARRWWWGAGSRLSTVVVVGAPWGPWFVGDVALPRSRPGLLLWWVASLVVVAGVVVADAKPNVGVCRRSFGKVAAKITYIN